LGRWGSNTSGETADYSLKSYYYSIYRHNILLEGLFSPLPFLLTSMDMTYVFVLKYAVEESAA
jgi:hypothetical protein